MDIDDKDYDINSLRDQVDKSASIVDKLRNTSGAFLTAAKTGRGGRCVLHMDVPSGVVSDTISGSGKIHFKDLVAIFSGDILYPKITKTMQSSIYPGLWKDFMGPSRGFIIAAAEYKGHPALYDDHDLNSALHTEVSIGFTCEANFNIICKLLSPKLDEKGKKVIIMEAVLNMMMADLVNLYFTTEKTTKIDMQPLEDWFVTKMAKKPPMKPLVMRPFEVQEEAYLYSTKIRFRDHDMNRHANNCVYIGLAQDAISSALRDNYLSSVNRADFDLGLSYCRIFYMAQCGADQILNIRVWESSEPLDHKTPLKDVSKPSDLERQVHILCSMEADGYICCQTVVRLFDAERRS